MLCSFRKSIAFLADGPVPKISTWGAWGLNLGKKILLRIVILAMEIVVWKNFNIIFSLYVWVYNGFYHREIVFFCLQIVPSKTIIGIKFTQILLYKRYVLRSYK